MIFNKKVLLIFTTGLVLRLILSAVSFHSDLPTFDLAGWVIGKGALLNFYDFLPGLPGDSFILKAYSTDIFNYPPMVYIILGLLSYPAAILSGPGFNESFLFHLPSVLGTWQLYWHLLALKLPYLIFDLGAAFLLTKLFSSPREKYLAFILWIFNPVNIYATYLVGQFDIIPVFFVILALTLILKGDEDQPVYRKLCLAALSLGLGAAFKIYPLFLLVPLAALTGEWKKRLILLLIGVLPYLLLIAPFLNSAGFRSTALVAGQTLKSLYAQVPISGGEAIILFPVIVLFFYMLFLTANRGKTYIWQDFFLVLLLFFIFTHYHPQWFLWITPFFIITLIKSRFNHSLAVIAALLSFTGLLFFFDSGLTLGLFSPVWPNLYHGPALWEILGLKMDYNFWRSLLQSVFVGSALFFIYSYFPRRETR